VPDRNGEGPQRVSLKDVAAEAGVGFGTASRTLSDSGYVAEKTRRRVLEAADRLGYRPNRLAAGLRSNRSRLIALLVPDYTNEFYARGSAAIARRLRDLGYQLIIATSSNGTEERDAIESLAEYRVDGIVRVPVDPDLDARVSCPVVELNRRSNIPKVSAVLCDDRSGFRALTEALLERGHRRIAMIVGEQNFSTSLERAAGYREAIAGTDVPPHVLFGSFDSRWGEQATREIFSDEESITAIIAASPRIASGAVAACVRMGVRVPDDLAFASYDDPEWFDFWGSGIHSFVPPLEEMARRAVEVLLDRLESPDSLPETIVLPGRTHEGGSIGVGLA
jgi:LacI family transcriptional regulator